MSVEISGGTNESENKIYLKNKGETGEIEFKKRCVCGGGEFN